MRSLNITLKVAGLETLHIEKVEVGYELDSKKEDTCTTILRTPSKLHIFTTSAIPAN